jgi:uncharacterized protein
MPTQGFHLMAKPAGAKCNLNCGYCFYLEKEQFHGRRAATRMDDAVLEAYVSRYIAAQPTPEVEFTWQGGEPTLMGLAFFERAVALQRRYAGAKIIRNTLQTNATLLDDSWCAFLARERFLVGVSLDGPAAVNDRARPDKRGRGSAEAALRGLRALQRHGVDFNVLVTVSSANVDRGAEVYSYLKDLGVRFMQFNPVVERLAPQSQPVALHFARPPELTSRAAQPQSVALSPHSVGSEAYGDFLIAVFDAWLAGDVGEVHVMNFEWALAAWCQLPATTCIFAERCGRAAIVEFDGSVYSCDHFMYPEYRLGNLLTDDPAGLLELPAQKAFGDAKADSLPAACRRCDWLFACRGECPKNRFVRTPEGEPGLNYLCAGYLKYFRHITPAMNRMARLLADGRDAADILLESGRDGRLDG